MKTLLSLTMAVILLSCNQNSGSMAKKDINLKSEEDKIFYSMGVMMGRSLTRLSLDDKEMNVLMKGLYDSASDGTVKIKDEELMQYQPKIQNLFRTRNEKIAKQSKESGKSYLEKFKKEEGVKVTASGIAYKTLKPGTGTSPKATDTVEVHYHGTLIDGTVFDSSVDRGKTTQFPLNQVIRGWTEGLQLMKTGGKTRFVIPSDLAYGDAGRPPKIPAGATLIFDVELFKIVKNDGKQAAADPHAGHDHAGHGHGEKAKAAVEKVKKQITKGGNATMEKMKEKIK